MHTKTQNMNITEKLKILGYDKRWLEYGYLTNEELENQFTEYSKAINEPDAMQAKKGC